MASNDYEDGLQQIISSGNKLKDMLNPNPRQPEKSTFIPRRSVWETREQAEIMQFKTKAQLDAMTDEEKAQYRAMDAERERIVAEENQKADFLKTLSEMFGEKVDQ